MNVLVTGSNSGIGLEATLELAKRGFTVFATMRDIKNKENILNKAKERSVSTELIHFMEMDVTDYSSVKKNVNYLAEEKYGLDILINNAGYCEGGYFEDLNIADFERQYQTNVLGVIRVTKLFVSLLKESKSPKIINISSVAGIMGLPGLTAYSSSKFALEGFSRSLRLEWVHSGIQVSLVQPTAYQTKIWDNGIERFNKHKGSSFKKKINTIANEQVKNSSDPNEVGKLIVKICRAKRTRLFYPVGKGARMISLLTKILPWYLIEKFVKTKLIS